MASLSSWADVFTQDLCKAVRPLRGRKVCPPLIVQIQRTLDGLLMHNLTHLVTVRCDNCYEVRIPGTWELVGYVNPWQVQITDKGLQVPWVAGSNFPDAVVQTSSSTVTTTSS